jgi:hypothetical protein
MLPNCYYPSSRVKRFEENTVVRPLLLLFRFMPQQRQHREELNRSALGHEEWGY